MSVAGAPIVSEGDKTSNIRVLDNVVCYKQSIPLFWGYFYPLLCGVYGNHCYNCVIKSNSTSMKDHVT